MLSTTTSVPVLSYVLAFLVGGGGVAIAGGLFKVGTALGRIDQSLSDLSSRMQRVELKQDAAGQQVTASTATVVKAIRTDGDEKRWGKETPSEQA